MITSREHGGTNLAIQQAPVEMAFETLRSLLLADNTSKSTVDEGLLLDESLIAAFRGGDHDAFTTLYRRHSRAVFQFVFYMAGNTDTADEVTQEVFVWLIHHPEKFDPARGNLPAFLGGVARNFLGRQRRAQSRWSPLEDAFQLLQTLSASRSSYLQPESNLDSALVRKAVALLPIRYREAIILCDLQENNYAETARILGCSVGTIRSRLHRGRSLLARKLNPSKIQGDSNAV
jgi:RNA polymerase sigma-70 factor (ECF subfamily)